MHIALAASAPIPQYAPLAFDQIIIAGCDEDVSSTELIEWIFPLLAGIPGGRWMSCQLEFGQAGEVLAHYRQGGCDRVLSIALDPLAQETRALTSHLPGAESMTMILLNDFTSQAMALLDGIARWLNIYEVEEQKLAPVLRLLGLFQTMMSA